MRLSSFLLSLLVLLTNISTFFRGPVRDSELDGLGSSYSGRPAVDGTFIQPDFCEDWTQAKFAEHFAGLKEAGIDTVVVQWTAETPYGRTAGVWYDSAYARSHPDDSMEEHPDMLGNMFAAAKACGMKLWVGLNLSDEWWSGAFTDESWRVSQSAAAQAAAAEIYGKFHADYADVFAGWYWSFEMYGARDSSYADDWAELLDPVLNFLTALDPSLPLMVSPFISSSFIISSGAQQLFWSRFLAASSFREGDIFCPQDSKGANPFNTVFLDRQLIAMKKAVVSDGRMEFWLNAEIFGSDYTPRSVAQFTSQLADDARIAGRLLCFSYSECYHPDAGFGSAYNEAYLTYLNS